MTVLEFTEPPLAPPPLRGRILLAEDGTHNQWVISYFLQQAGAEVSLAGDGKIACEQTVAAIGIGKPFDAILMDMQMPVMDGYAAAQAIREAGYGGPIIALTANGKLEQGERYRRLACAVIPKPIDREVLIHTVAEAIYGNRTRLHSREFAGLG